MDKIIRETLALEKKRQEENIELIASENYVSNDILELQGSIFTNKYAEGYPGKKYYGGCENIDIIENLAIEYACKLFNCKYANVQPHSGSSANMVAYRALLEHGDKVMGLELRDGGHLTHGLSINFSGRDYKIIPYGLDPETEVFDYENIRELALKERPKMIVTGATVYPRIIDFKKFREIADEVGAYLVVDMAHISGLIAAGIHPAPFPHAHIVTSTTQKTLRGPRGGLILSDDEEIAKKIDREVFPGLQGGPFMHVIAAKAQCFAEALKPEFAEYQKQVIKNAKALAETLKEEGFHVVSGGTDTHLLSINVKDALGITGKDAEKLLDQIHITVNKNTVPGDTESPFKASGIRLGSPAMTTRGLKEEDFKQIGLIISKALKNRDNENIMNELRQEVLSITKKYPLYEK